MPPLDWMPSSVVKESDDWGFTSMVQTGLSSLKESASGLMQPIGQQMGALLAQAEPAPEPQPQQAPAFQMPQVKPFELPDMNAWGMGEPEPQTPRRGPQTVSFSLPPAEAWGMEAPNSERRVTSGETGPLATRPSSLATPDDFNGYLRVAALRAGVDPEQVAKVMSKEGPTGWTSVGTFNTGTSYGPLQLHYAGGSDPKEGMGDRFTKATGIDLRRVDPKTPEGIAAHKAAVDYAMGQLVERGNWSEWYGADNAFPAGAGGQGRFTKVNRVQPMPVPTADAGQGRGASQQQQPAGAPAYGTYTAENLTPNQFSEGQAQGLSAAEAMAVCGPAAAVAFARANGRNPTLREAKELGSQMGVWDAGSGMHGPASQVQLLEKLGVPARLVGGADEAAIAREIQSGKPVTIDTPGHYYVATGYDPQTRTFEFGNSAGVLKSSKGRTRYRLDELAGLGMGAPRSTIFMGGR